jgi:hypothetical protein
LRQVSITLASRVKVRDPASQLVPIMMRRAITQLFGDNYLGRLTTTILAAFGG